MGKWGAHMIKWCFGSCHKTREFWFSHPFQAAWLGALNFVQQIVSAKKSIKSDPTVRRYNIWNQSAHGLVWICNSTPFNPLKSNQVLSIMLCSHLRLQAVDSEMLPFKTHHVVLSLKRCGERKLLQEHGQHINTLLTQVRDVKYLISWENDMVKIFLKAYERNENTLLRDSVVLSVTVGVFGSRLF